MNIIKCKDAMPVHKGIYRTFTRKELTAESRNVSMTAYYQYFNGTEWRGLGETFKETFANKEDIVAVFDIVAWQGSEEPPVGRWHKGTVKPVHVGVYQRMFEGGLKTYSKWDGKHWLAWNTTIERASKGTIPSSRQDMPWRGLQYDIR